MHQPEEQNRENCRVQKAILACLNAKPDKRATSKELIECVDCQAGLLCQVIAWLNGQKFIEGPVFSEEIIANGGDNSFSASTLLTDAGQKHFVSLIKEEQSDRGQ